MKQFSSAKVSLYRLSHLKNPIKIVQTKILEFSPKGTTIQSKQFRQRFWKKKRIQTKITGQDKIFHIETMCTFSLNIQISPKNVWDPRIPGFRNSDYQQTYFTNHLQWHHSVFGVRCLSQNVALPFAIFSPFFIPKALQS